MSISLKDPKTQKILAGVILGLCVLYVYLLTDFLPFTYKARAAELDELSTQYKELSSDLTKARQTINTLPYLEREFNLLHDKWTRAQYLLPDEQETAALLKAMTLLGDRSGVVFTLFRPLPATPAEHHTEHAIEVQVEGGYHEVGTFLSELANMERILTVHELSMEVPKKKTESGKPAIASFIAKAYTLGGTGVPPEEEVEGEEEGTAEKMKNGVSKQLNKAKQTVSKKVNSTSRGKSNDE